MKGLQLWWCTQADALHETQGGGQGMPQLIRAGGDKWLARVPGGGWNFKPHQKKANVEKRRSQLKHDVRFMCVVTARHVWALHQCWGRLQASLTPGSAVVKELSSSFRVGPSRAAEGLRCLGMAEKLWVSRPWRLSWELLGSLELASPQCLYAWKTITLA